MAKYGDIHVTVDELDAFVVALSPKDRPHPGQDLDAWYKDQINEIILDRIFLKRAKENQLDKDQLFLTSRREAARRLALQQFFRVKQADWEKIDLDKVTQEYEARKERLVAPEKRSVYHLFRRATSEEAKTAAIAELNEIRDRVLRGENFGHLAQELSDSESRHQEGNIGWVQRGMLQESLENEIFALQEGIPSKPVTAAEGAHLFYVDAIIPGKTLSMQDVQKDLVEFLRQQRRTKAIEDTVNEVVLPESALVVDRDTFLEASKAEDKKAVIFRLGDTELTMEEFLQNVTLYAPNFSAKAGTVKVPLERAWQAFESFRKTAMVEFFCQNENLLDQDQLAKDLAKWEHKALVSEQRRLLLMDLASEKESKLELFYQSNIGRFNKPTRVHLELFKVPLDQDADRHMARLETFANGSNPSLDDLSDMNGTREDLGWKTISSIKLTQPKLPSLISAREPGQVTPPVRAGKSILIAKIIAREESEPFAMEEIRQQLVLSYMEQYKPQLYQDLVARYVDQEKLVINPEGLASARNRGSNDQQDISAEKLEKMLEALEK